MSGPALSPAAAGLLRALFGRSGAARDRIVITDVRSTPWHSLTFSGERHRFALRILAPHAGAIAQRMTHRIEDAEFSIPGLVVADIELLSTPGEGADGSALVELAALTIDDA